LLDGSVNEVVEVTIEGSRKQQRQKDVNLSDQYLPIVTIGNDLNLQILTLAQILVEVP